MDYSMPSMTGPEATKEIVKLLKDSNIEMPYICCCSAYGHESYAQQAIAAGMNFFMSKPITSKDVKLLLSKADL